VGSHPAIYSFDRQTGWAKPFNAFFDVEKIVTSIPSLAQVAEKGACIPLGALSHYKRLWALWFSGTMLYKRYANYASCLCKYRQRCREVRQELCMTKKKTKILVLLSISIGLALAMVFMAGTQSATQMGFIWMGHRSLLLW